MKTVRPRILALSCVSWVIAACPALGLMATLAWFPVGCRERSREGSSDSADNKTQVAEAEKELEGLLEQLDKAPSDSERQRLEKQIEQVSSRIERLKESAPAREQPRGGTGQGGKTVTGFSWGSGDTTKRVFTLNRWWCSKRPPVGARVGWFVTSVSPKKGQKLLNIVGKVENLGPRESSNVLPFCEVRTGKGHLYPLLSSGHGVMDTPDYYYSDREPEYRFLDDQIAFREEVEAHTHRSLQPGKAGWVFACSPVPEDEEPTELVFRRADMYVDLDFDREPVHLTLARNLMQEPSPSRPGGAQPTPGAKGKDPQDLPSPQGTEGPPRTKAQPPGAGLPDKELAVPFVRQDNSKACARACVLMILQYYSVKVEPSVAKSVIKDDANIATDVIPGLSTLSQGKVQGESLRTDKSHWVADLQGEIGQGRPMIILVAHPEKLPWWKTNAIPHYLVVRGVGPDGSVAVNDPIYGRQTANKDEMERAWGDTKPDLVNFPWQGVKTRLRVLLAKPAAKPEAIRRPATRRQ